MLSAEHMIQKNPHKTELQNYLSPLDAICFKLLLLLLLFSKNCFRKKQIYIGSGTSMTKQSLTRIDCHLMGSM